MKEQLKSLFLERMDILVEKFATREFYLEPVTEVKLAFMDCLDAVFPNVSTEVENATDSHHEIEL